MWTIVLGPTFEIPLRSTADESVETLARWTRSGRCHFRAIKAGNHFTLTTPAHTRHFWSPTLSLEIREADGVPVASGRFNPSPAIWTGYMLTYLSLLTISLGAAMWGSAELVLGRTPWSLLFIPACIAIGLAMLWASLLGQRLARDEMAAMRRALDEVLDGMEAREPSHTREMAP